MPDIVKTPQATNILPQVADYPLGASEVQVLIQQALNNYSPTVVKLNNTTTGKLNPIHTEGNDGGQTLVIENGV